MESPFGAYRGGYQVLPQGWMEQATAPGRNYAAGIEAIGKGLSDAAKSFAAQKMDYELNKESAPTLLSQYQQVAEVTGQQVDPTILERYQNIGQMSGPQIQQFNQDVAAAQQQAIALANIQRQQQAFQMQQQAAQRAMQQQELQQAGSFIDQAIMQRPAFTLPTGQGGASSALFPPYR